MKNNFKIIVLSFTFSFFGSLFLSADDALWTLVSENIKVKPIAEDVWIHTSFIRMQPWGLVDANGLAAVRGNRLILVDTPWNDDQTRQLVEWFTQNHGCTEVTAIVCHYHQDNLGGLGWINRQGYDSYGFNPTLDICRRNNLHIPKHGVSSPHTFTLSDKTITLFFPGEGHTVDATCVYLPDERILFGGCSVKALANSGLGNTAEANLKAWPESLQLMKETFPAALIVVPGHGKAGDLSLIDHTISLLSNTGAHND